LAVKPYFILKIIPIFLLIFWFYTLLRNITVAFQKCQEFNLFITSAHCALNECHCQLSLCAFFSARMRITFDCCVEITFHTSQALQKPCHIIRCLRQLAKSAPRFLHGESLADSAA